MPSETPDNLNRVARSRRGFISESGQSLIELALLTPLLLLLVIGVVEMGRYAYLSILLGNAAESGALYGAQSLANAADTAGIQNAAQNDYKQNAQSLPALTITPSNTCGCDNAGTTTSASCTGSSAGTCNAGHWVVTVQVTATAKFTSLTKYPGIPQSLNMSRTVTMRVKQQ